MSNTQHGEPGDKTALPGRMCGKKEEGGPAQTRLCCQAQKEGKVAKGAGKEHPKDQEASSETGAPRRRRKVVFQQEGAEKLVSKQKRAHSRGDGSPA